MKNDTCWSRRAAMRATLGAGAALALPGRLFGHSLLPGGDDPGVDAPSLLQPEPLITRAIPSSGERIPIIGIGTAHYWRRRFDVGESAEERAQIKEVLTQLPELGGTVVDTAHMYGRAEIVVGDLVAEIGNRDALFLATKVGVSDGAPASGIAEMEESFRLLRTDMIDLMQVHNILSVDEMLPVLREWKQQGRVRYVGITTSVDRQYPDFIEVMEREELDFIQVDYSIASRTAADRILPLAQDRGMAVLINYPFTGGRIFAAVGDRELPDWAAEIDCATWAQFFLKYSASHPAVTCVIPGTHKMDYLVDNLGAGRGSLPDAEMCARMEQHFDAL